MDEDEPSAIQERGSRRNRERLTPAPLMEPRRRLHFQIAHASSHALNITNHAVVRKSVQAPRGTYQYWKSLCYAHPAEMQRRMIDSYLDQSGVTKKQHREDVS